MSTASRSVEIGDRAPEAYAATAEGSGQVGRRSHRPRAEKDPFQTETIYTHPRSLQASATRAIATR